MLTPSEYKILENCFLFSGNLKTDKEREKLNSFLTSGYCQILGFSKGETIFGNTENNKGLGVLLKGKVTAACSADEKSSLKIFSSGEVFGAASVFCETSDNSFAKVKANTACRVLFITKEGLKKLITDNPEIAFKYISFLCNRVEFLNRRISTFTSSQAAERLCKYILDNEKQDLITDVNFASLARTLDISRASLYRARSELERTNSVVFDGKQIKITNKTELKRVLDKNS